MSTSDHVRRPSMPVLVCTGCGAEVDAVGRDGVASRCPRSADEGIDHVLRPALAFDDDTWPAPGASLNPFIHYRTLLTPYRAALALGMSDGEFVALVDELDARIASVDGAGFRATPLRVETTLPANFRMPCGNLLVKVEADHVSGSHKARHLMGILLMLEIADRVRVPRGGGALRSESAAGSAPRLAIASCGNAALAAAVLARAARRPLDVFVPTWASGGVLERLTALGATIHACARTDGVAGDPCYLAFRRAVAAGAIPFCCQGPDNGLTIEGGASVAWEMIDALDGDVPDAVFLQVGGGALATAMMRGFVDAQRIGRTTGIPRLHAVQTRGCAPLVRAYDAVVAHILSHVDAATSTLHTLDPDAAPERVRRAARVARLATSGIVTSALCHAATHRAAFMQPWDVEPRSIATGILDDETYDWLAITEGMLRTGGYPVLADEHTLAYANRLAHDTTGIDVCVTGTAGLAGLMDALPLDDRLASERIAVVFSGHQR